MGLDSFNVDLQFDSAGKTRTVSYSDGDGCGHSALFSDPNTKLMDVVNYHLGHYKRGHRMEPKRKCTFELPHTSNGDQLVYYCTLEPHPGDNHELELRK
jgi:hypothetical protein